MPKKRHKPEEIVAKLRQVDVMVSQGQSMADAVRAIGVTEVTYYRWRSEFGGLKSDQVKRMKDLEAENARLRRAVADLTLDKQILKRPRRETSEPRPSPRLHRARAIHPEAVRAAGLPGARTASLDATACSTAARR
jgi:transposase-like protein